MNEIFSHDPARKRCAYGSHAFVDKKKVVPLQSADLLAWLWQNNFIRRRTVTVSAARTSLRWCVRRTRPSPTEAICLRRSKPCPRSGGFRSRASRILRVARSKASAPPRHDHRSESERGSLSTVQQMLGHDDIASTARYAHADDDDVLNVLRHVRVADNTISENKSILDNDLDDDLPSQSAPPKSKGGEVTGRPSPGTRGPMPKGVLFVHNNFPAQFRDLAETLIARGVPCAAIGQSHSPGLPNLKTARYNLAKGTTPGIFPLAVRAEADLIRAWGAYQGAKALKAEGFDPAVVVGHAGWGEMTLLPEIFPSARRVALAEFFYHAHSFDVGFDKEFNQSGKDDAPKVKAKNSVMSLAYAEADAIVTPTIFQASTLPRVFRDRARIIHEGVDVSAIRPAPAAPFTLDDGTIIAPGTPVVTHVNNKLEPLRGLHIFARALPRLLAEVPDVQVLIIGDEARAAYGGPAPNGLTWKETCTQGLPLDPARVHFLGRVDHERMLAALRLSAAHVYYTYPFVLSWSLVEAMALGCYVIGSDTPPLHDAIEDGLSGRLLPFFDVDALSQAMIEACREPASAAPFRAAARKTAVARFDREKGRAAWLALLTEMGLNIPSA